MDEITEKTQDENSEQDTPKCSILAPGGCKYTKYLFIFAIILLIIGIWTSF
ncbi:hypothetical protein J2755_001174 [Methanohalophilus levihalophilus]|nr:hypothetical protein [Methanohalophilus levihalophilus]